MTKRLKKIREEDLHGLIKDGVKITGEDGKSIGRRHLVSEKKRTVDPGPTPPVDIKPILTLIAETAKESKTTLDAVLKALAENVMRASNSKPVEVIVPEVPQISAWKFKVKKISDD